MRHGPLGRVFRLCLVTILLTTSGAAAALASQPLPSATPATEGDTQLYVGHGAQLTAELPQHWRPDRSLAYDYAGRPGFIASEPLTALSPTFDSLGAACDFVAESERFDRHGASEIITWRGAPACIVRTGASAEDTPVALVFAHPDPAEDGHNAHVAVTVDAAHFAEVTGTISFDPAIVTPAAYLDATIDFIATHSLWRDAIDWPDVRAEAHDRLGNVPDDAALWTAYPAIDYVLDQLGVAGADNHNYFVPRPQVSAFDSAISDVTNSGSPTGAALAHGIGYVSVPGFSGDDEETSRFLSEVRAVVTSQRSDVNCGWIVDLRGDTGGNMYPMVGGLAPLLEPGRLIGFRNANGDEIEVTLSERGVLTYDGERMDAYSVPVNPRESGMHREPVAVLIGPRNGSSGEATALVFAPRDQTRFFGEPTAGVATAPSYLYLFDGSLLSIATRWMVGPQGATYPEGVVPDVTVIPSDVTEPIEEDPVVKAAWHWLQEQPSCASPLATPAA